MTPPVLAVRDLALRYGQGETQHMALKGVSFDVPAGSTVGLVGESGSGKSSAVLAILGLLEESATVERGEVNLAGVGNLLGLPPKELLAIRGSKVGYVRQNPFSSLQPTLPLERQFRNMIRAHRPKTSRAEARALAVDAMEAVGLDDPQRLLAARAHELSGGMAQRVVIAMAMIHRPQLLLADEPTTGLDVTVQRRVLDTMAELVRSSGSSVLLVTHDIGVVANYCERVVVLYAGTVVEHGPVDLVLRSPTHPYTQALLSAIPGAVIAGARRVERGAVPDSGCPYAPRCPRRVEECAVRPALERLPHGVEVACHVVEEREHAAAAG